MPSISHHDDLLATNRYQLRAWYLDLAVGNSRPINAPAVR